MIFSKQFSDRIEKIADENTDSQKKEKDETFGSLKEDDIFEADKFEVVPREAVEKLTLLFKKQTMAVKNFIDKQELRMRKLETKLEVYDEENTRLFELLNKRIVRSFRISLFILIFIMALIVALQII